MSLLYELFEARLQKEYEQGAGAQIRSWVLGLAATHRDSAQKLMQYLLSPEETPLFNGLVTSAYARLTGDATPIHDFEYGGLGITAQRKGDGQVFGENQLHFAKLGGVALQGVMLNGHAGFGSCWYVQAGQGSYVSEQAMRHSWNMDEAFMYSVISDHAFAKSLNCWGTPLLHSRFVGTDVLRGATNNSELERETAQLERMNALTRSAQEVVTATFHPRNDSKYEKAPIIPEFAPFYIE